MFSGKGVNIALYAQNLCVLELRGRVCIFFCRIRRVLHKRVDLLLNFC